VRIAQSVAVAASLLLAALVATRVVQSRQHKAAVAAVRESLGLYAECMIGAPLEQGETATTRLRRIEAGLPETNDGAGVVPANPWPQRCQPDLALAHAVLESGRVAAPRGPKEATEKLDALVVAAMKDPSPADAPDLVDDLFHAAERAGVAAVPRRYPPAGRKGAPPPASPLTLAGLPALPVPVRAPPDELAGIDPLGLSLVFLDHKEAAWSCAFRPLHGEPLREVRCGELRRSAVGVIREDTAEAPGYVRTARQRFDRFELARPVPEGGNFITALPASTETVALYGDQLVWVTAHHWYARTVTAGREPLGEPVDLGEISGISPELSACPTRTALLASVKTYDALGEARSWRTMAARERSGGAWQRTPGRAEVDVGATWTCEGHAGTWTWFDRTRVTQVRCNADRCETHSSDPVALAWDVGTPLFAADLGGRALLLGLGTTPGPLLGKSVASVRMRMAPLAAIAKAEDVVLFSDQAHDGAAVSSVSVFVRDEVALALLLLDGDEPLPLRAIRLDALGDFHPVIVAN
jgi:hypothetical protein